MDARKFGCKRRAYTQVGILRITGGAIRHAAWRARKPTWVCAGVGLGQVAAATLGALLFVFHNISRLPLLKPHD